MPAAGYWADYFERSYVPALVQLFDALDTRVLAHFKLSDIAAEADAVRNKAWQDAMSRSGYGDRDPGDFADAAQDAGVTHYVTLATIRQGVINMFAAGIYHAFEQQLLAFYRNEILGLRAPKEDHSNVTLGVVKAALKSGGIDLELLASWAALDEFRLVANTVKHAEGFSAEELRKRRPDLFRHPDLPAEWNLGVSKHIFLPMMGEDLYVSPDDLAKYKDSAVAFWGEFGRVLSDRQP